MCGLCGFLYKDRVATGPSAAQCSTCFRLSTGAAPTPRASRSTVTPTPTSYVVRVRMEANGDTPRRVFDALAEMGSVSEQTHTGRNLRARIGYGGDLGDAG